MYDVKEITKAPLKLAIEVERELQPYIAGQYVYWYGGKGQLASENLARILMKQNPNVWTETYYQKAMADVKAGKKVQDCSGMICHLFGMKTYGSYHLKEYAVYKRKPTNKPYNLAVLYKKGHVALYLNNLVYEMANQKADFRIRAYDKKEWLCELYYPYIDYGTSHHLGWHRDNEGWWYSIGPKPGQYLKSEIAYIDKELYEFDEKGYMVRK